MGRGAWLASPDDGWAVGNRSEPANGTSTFIGGLGGVRLRAWPRGPLIPEVGTALFIPGPFVTAVDGVAHAPSFFAWALLTGRFKT